MTSENPMITIARSLAKLGKRVEDLETKEGPTFEIKTTAGDPTAIGNYHFVINTVDNTFKVYADSGWRTLASW